MTLLALASVTALGQGEKAAVLEFLERCGKFWSRDEGRLDGWAKAIKDGKKPDFGRHGN